MTSKETWYCCELHGDPIFGDADDMWHTIIRYGIHAATHFEAHFSKEDPAVSNLATGREESFQLPNVKVAPWSKAEWAIAVSGEMTPEARALFLQAAEDNDLWDYDLFRSGEQLLSVSDHDDPLSLSLSSKRSCRNGLKADSLVSRHPTPHHPRSIRGSHPRLHRKSWNRFLNH